MSRVAEAEVAEAVEAILQDSSSGRATIQELVAEIPERLTLSEDLRANVDGWAAAQEDEPGRSEAIRRLVELGLKSKVK
jgi:hypothetical protein